MQKALDILEKQVQWIALAIGAIYLLWIVYAYVLTPPVSATLRVRGAQQTITLGDVDRFTLDGPVRDLQTAMDNEQPIQISVSDFAQDFASTMKWSNADIKPFDPQFAWLASQAAPIKLIEIHEGKGVENKGPEIAIPAPPQAPSYAGFSVGRSEIAATSTPGTPANNPPPAAPGGSASSAKPTQDKIWASVGYTIPTDLIAKDFSAAKIPSAQAHTVILRIELERQEQLPDGTWSKEVTVKPLPITQLAAMPGTGDTGAQVQYQQWASSSQAQGILLQPPFYPTVGGDPWYVPGTQPPPPPAPPKRNFNPSQVRPEDVSKLTPEERQQYLQWRQQQQQQEQQRRRQQNRSQQQQQMPTLPGGPDIFAPGRGFSPSTLDQLGPLAQARPPMPPQLPPGVQLPGMPPDEMSPEMPGGFPGSTPRGYQPANVNDPAWVAAQKQAAGTIPSGSFSPSKTAPFLVWAHDENVQPGHVYRYRARYVLLNPLYHLAGLGISRAVAETFAIDSQYSDWSGPVQIPPVTVFFVDGGFFNNTARFQVFRWESGQWHGKSFIVSPGDLIGSKDDTAGVDYATGWTLVAISDPGASNPYALVTDGGGLERRGVRSDRNDPLFGKLKQEVAQTPPPSVPGQAGIPMMPGQ